MSDVKDMDVDESNKTEIRNITIGNNTLEKLKTLERKYKVLLTDLNKSENVAVGILNLWDKTLLYLLKSIVIMYDMNFRENPDDYLAVRSYIVEKHDEYFDDFLRELETGWELYELAHSIFVTLNILINAHKKYSIDMLTEIEKIRNDNKNSVINLLSKNGNDYMKHQAEKCFEHLDFFSTNVKYLTYNCVKDLAGFELKNLLTM